MPSGTSYLARRRSGASHAMGLRPFIFLIGSWLVVGPSTALDQNKNKQNGASLSSKTGAPSSGRAALMRSELDPTKGIEIGKGHMRRDKLSLFQSGASSAGHAGEVQKAAPAEKAAGTTETIAQATSVSPISTTYSTATTFTFTGVGLNRSADGDHVKFVTSTSSCSGTLAAGTGAKINVLPNRLDPLFPGEEISTTSQVRLTFTAAGTYKACYKVKGGDFAMMPGTITVKGVVSYVPTSATTDAETKLTFTGFGLNRSDTSGDSMKIVADTVIQDSGCSAADPAAGTTEVTNMGPNDEDDQETAAGSLTFADAGSYKVCYKLGGSANYRLLTTPVTVSPPSSRRSSR